MYNTSLRIDGNNMAIPIQKFDHGKFSSYWTNQFVTPSKPPLHERSWFKVSEQICNSFKFANLWQIVCFTHASSWTNMINMTEMCQFF